MGIMICEIHGRQGGAKICAHVSQQLGQGIQPKGQRLGMDPELFVCDECFATYDLDRFVGLADLTVEDMIDDARWDSYAKTWDLIPAERLFCVRCVDALEGRTSTA